METYNGEERRRSFIDLSDRVTILETKIEAQENLLKTVSTNVADIKNEITKYKGMLGGAMFVISCIVTAIGFARDYIFGKSS